MHNTPSFVLRGEFCAMEKVIRKRSVKSGLPPGTLIHIGEKSGRGTTVRVIRYNSEKFEEQEVSSGKELAGPTDRLAVTWYEVDGLNDVDRIQKLSERMGLHPLVMEDILNTNQRPKREDYGHYLYLVIKMLDIRENGELVTEQISLVLGLDFVVSFREGISKDVFSPVRERIRKGNRIRGMGADYLAYCLMDTIVDNYFTVLEEIGERIELLEEEVVAHPTPATTREIHQLKRDMIFVRRAVWPIREVIGSLERIESPLITEQITVYLRDLYDHAIQVIDAVETSRDMLSGMLDVYLSSISYKTNEIMRVLTVIATIFMPLSFLASLWGMNFRRMPELELRWGYPAALGIMAVIAVAMLVWFRKRRWL